MKLFVLGDSISIDYGPFLKEFLSGKIDYTRKGEEHYGKCDLNDIMINGRDSVAVLKYLRELFDMGFNTDIMLLNCGLHDIKTDPSSSAIAVSREVYEKNLREIFLLLKSHEIRVIWVRTTHVDDLIHKSRNRAGFHRSDSLVQSYNEVADRVAGEYGIPLADLNSFTLKLGNPESLFRDHIHFHESISRLQAAFIAGHILALSAYTVYY